MAEQFVQCPGCHSNLRVAAGRAEIVCPQCQTLFSAASTPQHVPPLKPTPTPQYQSHAAQQQQSYSPSPAQQAYPAPDSDGTKRMLMVLGCGGLAIGLFGILIAGIAVLVALRSNSETAEQSGPQPVVQQQPAPVTLPRASAINETPTPEGSQTAAETSVQSSAAQQPVAPDQAPTIPVAAPPPTTVAKPEIEVTPVARSSARMKYGWKPGDEHAYKIRVEAEIGGEKKEINAWCNYTVGQPGLAGFEEDRSGTGTGFVVAPNGYLLTCAHVVEDADNVEVTLAGRNYEATVVDMNLDQDLALIRISAQDLPALSLADSDQVKLAQDIRAVGFPMSDVLGTDLKITSGSVSGVNQEIQGKRFQIDASVNPGNSGGPVIDGQGRVIGIASAKLTGIAVSQVAFAVPSNQGRDLLRQHGIAAANTVSHESLSGPELAEQVKPSIALIKVTGAGNRKRYNVTYSGGYSSNIQVGSSSPSRRLGGSMRIPIGISRVTNASGSDSGSLQVSEHGQVSQLEAKDQLPLALGPVALLPMENIHNQGQSSWGTESQSALNVLERTETDSFPFGPRFGPRLNPRDPFNPFGSEPEEKVKRSYPAIERVRYRLEKDGEGEAVINKTYEFRTLESSENPYMLVKGSGKLVFDKAAGMPKTLDYNGTIQITSDNATVKIPFKLTYELRDPGVVAEERRKAKEEFDRRRAEAEESARIAASVPNSEKVDKLIQEIKSANISLAFRPMEELSKLAVVEERREEVVELAKQHIASDNVFAQKSAVLVIASWGNDDEQISILSKRLAEPGGLSSIVRPNIIETLGKHQDPDIAKQLASLLPDFRDQRYAKNALIAMGPVAEPAVIEILNDSEPSRRVAAEILQEIGTTESLAALEQAEQGERSSLVKRSLQQAREAIEKRGTMH